MAKNFLLASIIFLMSFVNVKTQDKIQRKQLFNSGWEFFLGDSSARTRDFDDKKGRSIDLPHDWSIEGKLDPKNPTGGAGGYFPAGIGWYRKEFDVPAAWKDKLVSIYFEGVYMNSEVFINGKSLGKHPYGYTSFLYDLTPYLDFSKRNILYVLVDNSRQINCRWYSGSGIYRSVWIIVTDPIHIPHWGVAITTREVSSEKATVQIKTLVKNKTHFPQNVLLNTQLSGSNLNGAGYAQTEVGLPANSEKEIEQFITISNPLLWAPETPHLYKANIHVLKDNDLIDSTNISFGIRSIKFSVENGFELNGKIMKINGGCVHHDNGCLGAAAFERAEERRVELLKSAGFNAVRTSHNPPSEAFLNSCDKLGMMVIDEAFDGWKESKTPYDYSIYFDQWWQRDIEAMVLRDRNHPSVIIWSTGNEIIERKKPEAVETANMLANYIRKIDPTRPVTSAMTTWDKEWEMFDPLFAAHDIGGYNYQLYRSQADHERVPSRIMVQTESYPKDAFTNWKTVQTCNYIIGDFVWTAMDYLGESGIGRYYYPGETKGEHWEGDFYPWHGAYCGDIDLIGRRKPISHYRNILWNNSEKLYLAVKEPNPVNGEITETSWSVWPTWESWTWPGYEGKDIQVEVYSKYPKVRLYLNNKFIDEQAAEEEQQYKTTFHLPYSSGLLKAVGIMDNKELDSAFLQTAGSSAIIKLIPDRTKISADGQDLSFVAIEITDKDGNLQPNAQNLLQFSISGPGVIAGVDNANLKDLDRYVGNKRKAWNGRALIVIRSTTAEGEINLKVISDGLIDAVVTIRSENNKDFFQSD